MENGFVTAVWLGGAVVAYHKERMSGGGRLDAFGRAVIWPFNLGHQIAARNYITDEIIEERLDTWREESRRARGRKS